MGKAAGAGEAGSAPASAPASGTPSGSEPVGLVADPGPEFDADAAAEEAGPAGPALEEPTEEPQWEEKVIRGLIRGKGRLLHAGIGVADEDWLYTRDDLEEIVPPLTRICNRYIPQLAKYADPAVLAAAMMSYATRSLNERGAALAAEAGDPGTQPIEPATYTEEVQVSEQPPAAEAPRAASSFPSSAPPPTPQEIDPAAAPPPPQPVEGIDPTQVSWER